MKLVFGAKTVYIVAAATFSALVASAAPAAAEPAPPPLPAPAPQPGDAPSADEAPSQAVTNAAGEPVPEVVPHLPSPDNLPPGTSVAPQNPNQPRLAYLRDLWHAMQTQEVSGADALLLLTQRPMSADATSSRGLPAGPQSRVPAESVPQMPAPDAPAPDAPTPDAPAPEAPTTPRISEGRTSISR